MAKYYGRIGFLQTVEKEGSVWTEEIVEKTYYGDVFRSNLRNVNTSDKLNDDVTISNEISIVADNFAYENSPYMKYVTYMGVKWKINSISIGHPRITLSIGGIYNGPEENTESET